MTVGAFDTRRIAASAAVLLLVGLVLATGCSEDKTNPTYPETPEPPVGTWFLSVWGSSADDVWAVGQPGLIYHWNGTVWQRQSSPTSRALTSVWGDGSGPVYITGHKGVILRNSGGGWNRMESGTEVDLFDVGAYLGTVMVSGREGTIRRLSNGSWEAVPDEVFIRDAEQAVVDTLYLRDPEDDNFVESFTEVGNYGIGGADGAVLMEDPEAAWQLRRIIGGREWVTCGASAQRISGNFIATNGGRLFQLGQADTRLVWNERYSPALEAIVYGIHADDADTVWAVTNDGRINRVDPDNGFAALYEDGEVLFDIWGTSGVNLYAVGINGRVLHFHEINPGEYGWELEELPDLPASKNQGGPIFDKFGRPVP